VIDKIYFTGFSSQGDGACFAGEYAYKPGAAKALKAHAPHETELHAIADALQALQRPAFYRLTASVAHSGHYYHEYCTRISVYDDATTEQEEALTDLLRRYMRWIYRRLEKEWEWLLSDAQIDETIESNAWEFHADGSLA